MDGWMGKGSAIKGPTRERCKRGLGSSGLLFFFLFLFFHAWRSGGAVMEDCHRPVCSQLTRYDY